MRRGGGSDDERKEGRMEGRKEGWMDGWMDVPPNPEEPERHGCSNMDMFRSFIYTIYLNGWDRGKHPELVLVGPGFPGDNSLVDDV